MILVILCINCIALLFTLLLTSDFSVAIVCSKDLFNRQLTLNPSTMGQTQGNLVQAQGKLRKNSDNFFMKSV